MTVKYTDLGRQRIDMGGGSYDAFVTVGEATCRWCGKTMRARSVVETRLLREVDSPNVVQLARSYADCMALVPFERTVAAHERGHYFRRLIAWVREVLS